ncbi:MAG: antA/AntB antirepressor family protein [Pseudomonadota bacterium]
MNAREDSQFPLPLKAPGGLAIPAEFAEIASICTATEIEIGGRTMFGIADARDLYAGLKVGRDYTTWIKGRIDQYGFREGVDYEKAVENQAPPFGGTMKSTTYEGAKTAHTYRLTLAMGKEVAMVENNDQGRLVRRYFLWLETQVYRPVDPIEALRDPVTLRALLLQHTEERLKLEAENKVLEAKAETLARLEGADDLFGIRVTAKLVQMPERKFVEWVQQIKWAYRQTGGKALLCYADKRQAGLCRLVPKEYEKQDGSTGVRETLKFTMKGVVRLAAMLNIKLSEDDLFAARMEG